MTKKQLRQWGAILPLLLCACLKFAEAQQPVTTFRDCAECPQMVVIPAGGYLMGTSEIAQNTSRASEGPQHLVTLKAFAIGKFEVTQAEWTTVMGDDPSSNKGVELPVEGVSWNAANAFVEKLSKKTGRAYRLPTEAEWEYSARAGSTTAYAFGEDEAQLSEHGWFDGNSGMATHPIGEKPANKFGLHDMQGNVWEWVQDCFHENYIGAQLTVVRPRNTPLVTASAAVAPGMMFLRLLVRPIALRMAQTTVLAVWGCASPEKFRS